MKYVFINLFILICCSVSQASYNQNCLEQLTISPARSKHINQFREEWLLTFHRSGIARAISDLEYEACMDLTKGLTFSATTEDGRKIDLRCDDSSIARLVRILRNWEILEVQYSPESLQRVGRLLQRACEASGRKNCSVYSSYQGWTDSVARPFSMKEERAIKWATLHLMPFRNLVASVIDLPADERLESVSSHFERRLFAAQEILNEFFPRQEGQTIYSEFVYPILKASFERVLSVSDGDLIQ